MALLGGERNVKEAVKERKGRLGVGIMELALTNVSMI